MKDCKRASVQILFILALAVAALAAFQLKVTEALAEPSFFTSQGCNGCHSAPVVATCNGCHHHGPVSLKGVSDKTSYAPGETVSVTLTGGSESGWFRAVLYDQNSLELSRSTGNASGMGSSATYPAVLTAPAPATAGTYTWKVAWYGNQYDTSSLGSNWTPDATNANHGEVRVSINSFTVTAPPPVADTTKPVVSAFSLPATAASLTVPVSSFTASDNVAVTGYLITTSATAPLASAAGWSASAPANAIAAAAGNVTFYAWAKDAAGNVSLSYSALVSITLPASNPLLTVSTLDDGAVTNNPTLNVSGSATDPDGITSVTLNGKALKLKADGSFSAALKLITGSNAVKLVATDTKGNQSTDLRTITYDKSAPLLTIDAPADHSVTADSFITVSGTINESSTVNVANNGGPAEFASVNNNSFTATVNLVPKTNTLIITATDLAGNKTKVKRTIYYDNVKPALAVSYPHSDITTKKNQLVLKGNVKGTVGTVSVVITMGTDTFTPPLLKGNFSQLLTFTTTGDNVIVVTATDDTGSSSVQRNVIYQP